jgi:REP element-mobilizing transposase RayT
MAEHRNSQRRIYLEGYPYFVTTVTYKRERYFENNILAELFVSDLRYAESLKQFVLHGYSVLPDHAHLLFTPSAGANYSEIMRSLKTNFARDANDIMFGRKHYNTSVGDVAPRRLQRIDYMPRRIQRNQNTISPCAERIGIFHQRFIQQYGTHHVIPFFKWQKSFRDHVIRDQEDFNHHLEYIVYNAVKHQLVQEPEQWQWVWSEN